MNFEASFTKQKMIRILAVSALLMIFITILFLQPINAAVNGDLTFSHGVNQSQRTTFGSTYSTAVENNMYFGGWVQYFSGPDQGYTIFYASSTVYNVYSATFPIYTGPVSGASLFYYYVDSALQLTSTAWWYFDFR